MRSAKSIGAVLAVSVLICLSGCLPDSSAKISQLEERIKNLEAQIKALEEQNKSLDKDKWTSLFKIWALENRFASKAEFTPSSQGYQAVWTPAGNLLVSLDDITKYANGYKLHFRIGNPTIATFSDVKAKISWNRVYEKGENYSEWEDNKKTTSAEIRQDLKPGQWNRFIVTIGPATEKETGQIEIELDANRVVLYTSPQ